MVIGFGRVKVQFVSLRTIQKHVIESYKPKAEFKTTTVIQILSECPLKCVSRIQIKINRKKLKQYKDPSTRLTHSAPSLIL